MSTTGLPGDVVSPEVVAPIIQAYARSIRPAFSFILISATFSAILIPLLVMLFALSTSRLRRKPIFILNVFTITLGLIVGVLSNHLTMSGILSPLAGVNSTEDLVYNILYVWLPWITEAILILRVITVYTPAYSSRRKIAQILAFSVIVKFARAVLTIMFLVDWRRSTSSGAGVNQFATTKQLTGWMTKAVWTLELVDNTYISGLFLWRLAVRGNIFRPKTTGYISSEGRYGSFTDRLKSLFWIATTNLVFPLIFNLMQIIIIFAGDNILLAASIEMASVYVAIISTAFATIWSSTSSFKEAHQNTDHASLRATSGDLKIEPMAFFDPSISDMHIQVKSSITMRDSPV